MLAMLDENLTVVVDRCAAPFMALRGGAGGGWHAAGELIKVNAHTGCEVEIVALVLHHRNPRNNPREVTAGFSTERGSWLSGHEKSLLVAQGD
jgi:hypothetical protein